MAALSMEEEIALLKEELARLKEAKVQQSSVDQEVDETLDALVEGVADLEGNIEEQAQEILARMKDDYENMSPVTAVAIFAAGALFGRLFLSK